MKQVYKGERVHAKIWTGHVEDTAMEQIKNLCALPFIHKHVAIMPDVHCGYGSTVGSVIPTKGAIISAAVGVDIGCGMMAVKIEANIPDNLSKVRSAIEAVQIRSGISELSVRAITLLSCVSMSQTSLG